MRIKFLQAVVLALLVAEGGCASLRPPDPEPLARNTDSKADEATAGWWALGTVLNILGPWLTTVH